MGLHLDGGSIHFRGLFLGEAQSVVICLFVIYVVLIIALEVELFGEVEVDMFTLIGCWAAAARLNVCSHKLLDIY